MKITGNLKVLPGQSCLVLNYRMRPAQWEHGVVSDARLCVDAKGKTWANYDVQLDRYSARGIPIRLYVGDDKIYTGKEDEVKS